MSENQHRFLPNFNWEKDGFFAWLLQRWIVVFLLIIFCSREKNIGIVGRMERRGRGSNMAETSSNSESAEHQEVLRTGHFPTSIIGKLPSGKESEIDIDELDIHSDGVEL